MTHNSMVQVAVGHARLTDAKLLLRDAGAPPLASALAKEINDALHDLQAPAVLDQLKARLAECSQCHTYWPRSRVATPTLCLHAQCCRASTAAAHMHSQRRFWQHKS